MKKLRYGLTAAVCLLLVSFAARAQYTLTALAPPPNPTFNDLWHFTVVRGASDSYTQFYISLRIFNETNQLKVKSNTVTLSLTVGSHYYNLTNLTGLQPFTTSYYDAALLQDAVNSGGQLPPGTYNLSYTLYGKAPDGDFMPLAEENTQAVVDVMWPPVLIWPEDGDTIPDPNPSLIWTPAYSSSYTGSIFYLLNIVEKLPGQSKEQAIKSNALFHSKRDLPNTFYPYVAPAPALQSGKTYVWQVTATIGSITATSQVWEFVYATSNDPFSYPANLYTPVTEKLDGGYHLAKNRILKIKYTEEYDVPNNSVLQYNIYDKDGIKIRSSLPPMNSQSAVIKKGDNFITLSLGTSGLNLTSTDDFYILEVMNHKNEKWYLRFRIILSGFIIDSPTQ